MAQEKIAATAKQTGKIQGGTLQKTLQHAALNGMLLRTEQKTVSRRWGKPADLSQRDVLYVNPLMQEELSRLTELVGVLRGEIMTQAVLCTLCLNVGMAHKVVF